MNGILSGMPPGILMDPRQAMMLQTGLGLMSASGPSTTPVGLGQAIGKAGMQGLNAFQQTAQANQQNQLTQLKLAEAQREAEERKKKEAALLALRNDPRFANLGPLLDVAPAAAIERGIPKPPQQQSPFSRLQPKDYTPDSLAKFQQSGNVADLVAVAETPKPPSSVQEYEYAKKQGYTGTFEQWDKDRRKAGATNVKVPVNLAGNKYAEVVGSKSAERDIGQHDTAQSAVDNLAKLDLLTKHLEESDAITGLGAEVRLNLERAKQLVMQDVKSGKTVSDTQLLDALLGSDVFPMIKALGIGARGLDTPAEREFLRQVMTGTITMDKQALIKLTKIRRDIAERAVDRWNQRVESGELDRYFEFTHSQKGKLELPSKAQFLGQQESEDWVKRAMRRNMMTREQVIAEGVRLGKLRKGFK